MTIGVTVWPLTLPSALELHRDFGEIWSFETSDLHTLYGANASTNYSAPTARKFEAMMTDSLLPPDSLYKAAPYGQFDYYERLASSGAYLLNLADIGRDPRGCPANYTPAQLNATLQALAPTIERLRALDPEGTNTRPYVYGYDEQPPSCEHNIRALFGAVKERWPWVATAAVLNWPKGLPADLPLDIWIVQYGVWTDAAAEQWKKSGASHQVFLYHCIEPSGPGYLNTFIERPRTQGRLLYWLGAKYRADGWLYYATDLWRPRPGTQKNPIRWIDGGAHTDFDPANYVWSPRTDIWANGDGQFVYPGLDEAGTPLPIASARLELQRDAVEDMALLRLARTRLGDAAVDAAITKLVRSPTDHEDDREVAPALLEATRRALAGQIMSLA